MLLSFITSDAFAHAVKEHVFCNDVVNPQLTGVLLQSPNPQDPPLRLYYKFKVLVQDGAAQKYCLSIKRGLRLKILCQM